MDECIEVANNFKKLFKDGFDVKKGDFSKVKYKSIKTDIAAKDITDEEYEFVDSFLKNIEYDDYDKLIILCDSLATAFGFCTLDVRFVDTTRRYGAFPFTVDRWEKTIEIKKYFEEKIGQPIYKLLPDIEDCIYW